MVVMSIHQVAITRIQLIVRIPIRIRAMGQDTILSMILVGHIIIGILIAMFVGAVANVGVLLQHMHGQQVIIARQISTIRVLIVVGVGMRGITTMRRTVTSIWVLIVQQQSILML